MPTLNNGFTIVSEEIKTTFQEDDFAVLDDTMLRGGLQVQDSLSAIQAISQDRLKVYMFAVDGSAGITYQYVPNPSSPPNYIWTPYQAPDAPRVVSPATGSQTPNFAYESFEYVMSGNLTVANASNVTPGQTKNMQFKQNGTGSLTLSWGSAYETHNFTLNTAANGYTEATIYCDSAGILHVRGS